MFDIIISTIFLLNSAKKRKNVKRKNYLKLAMKKHHLLFYCIKSNVWFFPTITEKLIDTKKKKNVGIWASLIFFDQGQELKGKGFIFFIFSVPYFNIFKASYKVCPVHEKI